MWFLNCSTTNVADRDCGNAEHNDDNR
jgi:hypothetical protein